MKILTRPLELDLAISLEGYSREFGTTEFPPVHQVGGRGEYREGSYSKEFHIAARVYMKEKRRCRQGEDRGR